MNKTALTILLAGAGLLPLRDRTLEERPNVLFIVFDDMNDYVGPLGGNAQARTPNLDRFAERSMLFTNAHAPATVCNPSRTAVLTGVPPHRSGIYANQGTLRHAMPDVVTLPQYFKQNGYRVLGAGKVFHDADPESWDTYYPSRSNPRPQDPKPADVPANGEWFYRKLDWAPLDVPEREMGDSKVAGWVAGQLARGSDEPFFLACGIYLPHPPWYVPEEYFEALPLDQIVLPETYEGDLDDLPRVGRSIPKPALHEHIVAQDQWAKGMQAYLAAIMFADRQLGRILAALEQGPNAEDTVVVLWSDHGYHLGEKQHWTKSTLWEQATRVPLMVSRPGGEVGRRCTEPVSLMDLYPTLIELCGLPERADLFGTSLVRQLEDPQAKRVAPALTSLGQNGSLRSARWRYTRYFDGTEELYDHEADPDERINLAGLEEHDAVKSELARWLPEKWVRAVTR